MKQARLYKRFGIGQNVDQIKIIVRKNIAAIIQESLSILAHPFPNLYTNPNGELGRIQIAIMDDLSRLLPAEINKYIHPNDRINGYCGCFKFFIESEFGDGFHGSFEEWLVRLQILLEVLYLYRPIRDKYYCLCGNITQLISDQPVIELSLVLYKSKAAQFYPATSKKFEDDVRDVLGLLEKDQKYQYVLVSYECGLKEFLQAKEQSQLKDVIEDMHGVCDELVKAVTGDSNKSFKHFTDKDVLAVLGLNSAVKELMNQLRRWLDDIKHGKLKDYDKHDVEMIISIVGVFVRYIINKHS